MNLAFYAPMKPPDHPVPSGDRLIARLLVKALRAAGHRPLLASRFRSWEGAGDPARQDRLRRTGERIGDRLLRRFKAMDDRQRPRCWFSYHLYHKAPDWLGPRISRELGIPYVVVEASVAPKQSAGAWRDGYTLAVRAIAGADLVVALNSIDVPCVAAVMPDANRLVRLTPFLDLLPFDKLPSRDAARQAWAGRLDVRGDCPWLVTVAMMRVGNKLDSYRVLAQTLESLKDFPWRLIVAGDGPARAEVEAAFQPLANRVAFAGMVPNRELPGLLRACDLFVWPAVREPLGMSLLEAHAAGLGTIAGNSGGVSDLVVDGDNGRLVAPGDTRELALVLEAMLKNPEVMRTLGQRARVRAFDRHGMDAASARLDEWLSRLPGIPAR